jgi:hypothetical protein
MGSGAGLHVAVIGAAWAFELLRWRHAKRHSTGGFALGCG